MPEEKKEVNDKGSQEDKPDNSAIEALRKESGNYRVQRNDALRRAFVLEEIVSKHGIDTKFIKDYDMTALTIKDGVVSGKVDYTPPKIESKVRSKSQRVESNKGKALTLEDYKKMSVDDINKNWDKIKALLRQQGQG